MSADGPVGSADPAVTEAERAEALRAGAPRVPRRAIVWGFSVAAVLALGGTLGERAFSAAGLNPVAPAVTTTTVSSAPPPVPLTLTATTLLGREAVPQVLAPAFTLRTPRGEAISLASLRGRLVVLSFFDPTCADQCAVVARELELAGAALGADRGRVAFLTVDADPLEARVGATPPIVARSGLARLASWSFLTGPLSSLDGVWRAYGVAVDVYPSARLVVHTDPVWIVAPDGRLDERLSPLVVQAHTGTYSLPAVLVRRAGRGLASELRGLLRSAG